MTQAMPEGIGLPAAYCGVDPSTRTDTAQYLPRCVFIEVTNRCNLRCATCVNSVGRPEPVATLTLPQFEHIVAQFPAMERAVLHGIGEPLLNPNLTRMIRALKDRGVTVLFNTNGTLLSGDRAAALIESGLDELRCSVGGADPDTYARIHGAPLLSVVMANLRGLIARQRRLGVDRPHASFWVTALRENLAEIPALVRLAAEIGVPRVHVQRLVYFLDTRAQGADLMRHDQAVFRSGSSTEEAVIAEAQREADRLGVVLTGSGAADPRRTVSAHAHPGPCPWSVCVRPWTSAYITANGNALPCCFGPFATSDYGRLVMGNVLQQDFAAIWNGAPYRAWRRRMLSDTPVAPCAGCGVHWSL